MLIGISALAGESDEQHPMCNIPQCSPLPHAMDKSPVNSEKELANLAQEIDHMKEVVAHLRAQADKGASIKWPSGDEKLDSQCILSQTSQTPPATVVVMNSPAARLQAFHEEQERSAQRRMSLQCEPASPPKNAEFPEMFPSQWEGLTISSEWLPPTMVPPLTQTRRPSYAAVAAGAPKAMRFAQPTKATTRRADPTFFQTMTNAVSKTPEKTPKSASKNNNSAETTSDARLRSRLPRRNALPSSWTKDAHAAAQSHEEELTKGCWSKKDLSSKPPSKTQTPPSSPPKPKTSTYMSPTKATAQRALVTLGAKEAKRAAAHVKSGAVVHERVEETSSIDTLTNTCKLDSYTAGQSFSRARVVDSHDGVGGRPSHGMLARSNRLIMPLRAVENTVIQRRTSHSHLLTPIFNKLERYGLLRDESSPTSPSPSHSPDTVDGASRLRSQTIPNARPESMSSKKSIAETLNGPYNLTPLGVRGQKSYDIGRALDDGNRMALRAGSNLTATPRTQSPMMTSSTAPVLVPTTCNAATNGTSTPTVSPIMATISRVDSAAIPPDANVHAKETSKILTVPYLEPSKPMDEAPMPPFHNEHLEENSCHMNLKSARSLSSTLNPKARPFTLGTLVDTFAPDCIEAVSDAPHDRANLSPRPDWSNELISQWIPNDDWLALPSALRKSIHKARRDINNGDHSIMTSFNLQNIIASESMVRDHMYDSDSINTITPTLTQRSWTSSPPKTPLNSSGWANGKRGWTVGPENAGPGFGWRGGNGKEIRFVRHGPDAERSKIGPVTYNNLDTGAHYFFGQQPSLGLQPTFAAQTDYVSPNAPMDRLTEMLRWSAGKGYPKIPCENYDLPMPMNYSDCMDAAF